MATKQVTVHEVESICHKLAQEILGWNEPIPNFSSRSPGILESCLLTPFATYGKKFLYHGLWEKAAILFYLMIKNHPFENGNKRVALVALVHFLYKNNYLLEIGPEELYNLAKDVAKSNPKTKDEIVKLVRKIIQIGSGTR